MNASSQSAAMAGVNHDGTFGRFLRSVYSGIFRCEQYVRSQGCVAVADELQVALLPTWFSRR